MSLIAPLIEKHPDLATRIGRLSADDFMIVCEREGVQVEQIPSLRVRGYMFWFQSKPFIAVSDLDPFVCFHELGHYLGFKREDEADRFAVECTGLAGA